MTSTSTSELVYDPYDHETIFNPHAIFRRLRDEAPLYYSERYDFYAISRFEASPEAETPSSRIPCRAEREPIDGAPCWNK